MKTLAILLICGVLQFFFPWWVIVIVCFLIALILVRTPLEAFCIGFVAIFALWTIACLVQSIPNEQLLAVRVAQMFHVSHAWILTLVTGIFGGVIAGISGLCGYFCRIFWVNSLPKNNAHL